MASQHLVDITTLSPKFQELYAKTKDFVENECIPAEKIFELQLGKGENRWKVIPPIMQELKAKARALGLWNIFLGPDLPGGAGLTNLEFGMIAELLGRCPSIAPDAMNCAPPDPGNIEVIAKYGTAAQKEKWLYPLLEDKIRSCFAMTEPKVASSDATNIETSIRRVGDEYVINGRKWWITGLGNPRCEVLLVMGKTDSGNNNKHRQQSIVIVPRHTPGVNVIRPMEVFGFDDAFEGHMEVEFKDVRIPVENLLLGEGRGFEIAQSRLGAARIHHCMRYIGMAERGLELMLARVTDPTRRTFGKNIAEHETVIAEIAKCRMDIDQARFIVLNAALRMDQVGGKGAMKEIGIAKVVVPNMLSRVIDRAIQAHGAAGLSQDVPLGRFFVAARTLRIMDGPDEIHRNQIGKIELRRADEIAARIKVQKEKSEKLIAAAKL